LQGTISSSWFELSCISSLDRDAITTIHTQIQYKCINRQQQMNISRPASISNLLGCVKCKLALHGLAAYLLNCLQQSSNAAVYKADVNKDGGC